MITLTTPPTINSVIGGNVPLPYNKLVIGPFTMDGISQTINGNLRLTSTTNPTAQPIAGTLRISVPTSSVIIEIPQLIFYNKIPTTSGMNDAILAIIEASQAQIENGLIALGAIAGVRTPGV